MAKRRSALGGSLLLSATCLFSIFGGGPSLRAAEQNPPPASASPEKLTGATAWQQLVGNTVVAQARGGGYTEYYAPDGGVVHLDADGNAKGRWSLEGDKVCFDFPEEDDRSCVAVEIEGGKGTFVDEDKARDTFDVLPGNAKAL